MGVNLANVVCIMNPTAGTRRQVRLAVEQELETAGVDFVFYETQAAGHAFQLAKDAVVAAAGVVIGIGGDGTLNEVARALVNRQVPLGLIPVGSGNAFARALNISTVPQKACRQLLAADVKRLDVGMVEDEIFLSTAGVGIDAEVAWLYAARKGKRRGMIPYLMLTLQVIRQYKPKPLKLFLDDQQAIACCPLGVVVANTAEYGNGVIIAPGAHAEDGVLDVRIIEPKSLLSIAMHGWRLFMGSIDEMPGVRQFKAQKVRIERDVADYFQFDGEARRGPTTLNFTVKPKALSVLVPKRDKCSEIAV